MIRVCISTHKEFRKTVKSAKHTFFDDHIADISEKNACPWNLMSWVKEHKNPPSEAIHYNGEPCHELGQLWNTLHST